VGRGRGQGGGRGKEEEMTQTLYAHINKINFKKRKPWMLEEKKE
jgi:hypothetical protein